MINSLFCTSNKRCFIKIIVLSIFAIHLSGCGLFTKKAGEDSDVGRQTYQPEKNPVDTVILRKTNFMSQLISNGKLRAMTKSSLKFPIQGIVAELRVKNGDIVNKGDIIAVLDKRDAENKHEQATITFRKAELQLNDALFGFGYTADSFDKVPEETMKIARTRSGYEDALLSLKAAELTLENCTLRSPIAGKIADLETKQYEYPAGNEFCKVLDNNTFEVEFSILETELEQVRIGQGMLISTFTESDKRYNGKVTEINPIVDAKGQIRIKAEFKNPGNFIDGMNVKVFVENAIPNKLVVPKSAVLIRDNLEVLFVFRDNKAAWTYVNVLMTNSNSCVVVANEDRGAELKEGDAVIISGNLNLADGSNVEIKQ